MHRYCTLPRRERIILRSAQAKHKPRRGQSAVGSILKKLALAILVALAMTAPARADFADGWAAYQARDYAAALDQWLPLAIRGDLDAL